MFEVAHGEGFLFRKNGSKLYEGSYKFGIEDGFGKEYNQKGDLIYVGYWNLGLWSRGVWNGEYPAQYKNYNKNKILDEGYYDGSFDKSQLRNSNDGIGYYKGFEFRGIWLKDKPLKGKLFDNDGFLICEGNWKKNNIYFHTGTHYWKNGSKYVGIYDSLNRMVDGTIYIVSNTDSSNQRKISFTYDPMLDKYLAKSTKQGNGC